uniref:Uncharacterized protein n=1 Tax=Eutreptiella gymnastica TaxID=73025 RepID=A0A7S4FR92_9EUGL|mmetsp:Transcript_37379/g.62221  ORF Transcript_37379/g.62221 Transcript_37379/m.62221 type:complete len:102 (+) Transcript_37379:426-731(+)|eukprot:CAMPEP_0174308710 /NCGR_PEP_ID=MMETSP0810-20121108/1931_1 /TAXON_ID=73025 ORGANISM="Eutreptiella gymnastica-like, Strain CCMP1594" /NCGR_SAMPLE_ID=MMETSP0810 /ASSEMBLY_ACC=CAM_ASM_000659 /LENGTH=101 /DNA_ID=CAMNT_0015416113 /DNA_START=790 /DNA_END=1095 /DNA_ORIENTATION=+
MAGIYSWVVGGRNQPALAVKAGVPPPHSGGVPGVCSAGEGQRLCTSNDDSAVLYCRAEKRARQRAAQTAHRPGAEDARRHKGRQSPCRSESYNTSGHATPT